MRQPKAVKADNDRIVTRMQGVPAQKGTPESDSDPRNPNTPPMGDQAPQPRSTAMPQDTTPDFREILSQPMADIKRPPPLPAGTYHGVITQRRFDKSPEKGTLFVEFTFRLTGPGDGVDPNDLDGIDLTKRSMRHTYYLTPDALWRLNEFLKSIGIETDNRPIAEGIEETINQPVLLDVVQQLNKKKPTEPPYNNINDVRGAR